ncbi:MAG: hypothetical protein V4659_03270 [Pseudomonadota bacterium]
MRRLFGVIIGIVVANLTIFGSEYLGPSMPWGIPPVTVEDLSKPGTITAMPLAPQGWIVFGWFLGAFVGSFLAFRIARWDFAGFIVAALVAAAGVANLFILPHPLWMSVCAVALPFVGATLAFGLYRRARAADLHLRGQ